MKTEFIYFENLKTSITYYIGKNSKDNFDVIDIASENDLWFHANNYSSCHVVAILPKKFEKKEMRTIINKGAFLCKQNTTKLRNIQNIEIIYTQIKNITKTNVEGCVETINTKLTIC